MTESLRTSPRSLAALLVAAALLSGCSVLLGSRSDPPRLYVLTAEPPAAASAAVATDLILGLGPVNLPGYLDRKGIVTRVAANRLEASRNDLWAESLAANFKSVLEQDLRLRLPGVTIRSFPWGPSARPQLSVAVEVARFEATAAGTAELHARWTLADANDRTVLVSREAELSQPIASGGGTEALVAALGQAIAALSEQIVAEVAARADTVSLRRATGR